MDVAKYTGVGQEGQPAYCPMEARHVFSYRLRKMLFGSAVREHLDAGDDVVLTCES
jgi:hypothetical protein